MSEWHKKDEPVSRGKWRGCLRLRYKATSTSSERRISYVPDAGSAAKNNRNKDRYDAYEKECWNAGTLPESPEQFFAVELDQFLDARADRVAAIEAEAEAAKSKTTAITIAEFVGTKDKPGPFWSCTVKKGEQARARYYRLVTQLGPLAKRPMASITDNELLDWFHEQLACPSCVERATTNGTDVPAADLVPYIDVASFDGACLDHHTKRGLATYTKLRMSVGAVFNAAKSDKAVKHVGHRVVEVSPGPTESELLDDVEFLTNEAEELRYGLTEEQVRLQTKASPAGYEAIPFFAVFTLNRAGQELSGINVADISLVERADNGGLAGRIEIRRFFTRRNGPREMSRKGKTRGAVRTIYVPLWVALLIVEYIEKYRSTPSRDCPACKDGHRHWGGQLRDQHATNPHVGCDFAADAPLFIHDETRQRLDPSWYVQNIWHPANEKAGLTQEKLGWTPQLRHSRSTGSTLHIDYGTDPDEVVKLGGWSDRQMLMEHYEKHRPGRRAAMAVAAFDETDELSPKRLVRRLEAVSGRLERALRLLAEHGIDYDPTPMTDSDLPRAVRSKFDRKTVSSVLLRAVTERLAPSKVIEALDATTTKTNYARLAALCAELGVAELSNGKQLPHGNKTAEMDEWYRNITAALADASDVA